MRVTYDLIYMSFSAHNEAFRFLEIFAIVNPIVNYTRTAIDHFLSKNP